MEKMFVVSEHFVDGDNHSSATRGLFTEEQAREYIRISHANDELMFGPGTSYCTYDIVEVSVETGLQAIKDVQAALDKSKENLANEEELEETEVVPGENAEKEQHEVVQSPRVVTAEDIEAFRDRFRQPLSKT